MIANPFAPASPTKLKAFSWSLSDPDLQELHVLAYHLDQARELACQYVTGLLSITATSRFEMLADIHAEDPHVREEAGVL